MTTCSLSEALAAGVSCNREIWIGIGLAVIGGLCLTCLVVGFFWDACYCRSHDRRRHEADADVEGQANASSGPPSLLRVVSPNKQAGCTGEYELVKDQQPNNQPLWMRKGGGSGRWLYSGLDGRWYVCGPTSMKQDFRCSSGYIYFSKRHKGVMPHALKGVWEWSSGNEWHKDPGITVTGEFVACLPPTASVASTAKRVVSTPTLEITADSVTSPRAIKGSLWKLQLEDSVESRCGTYSISHSQAAVTCDAAAASATVDYLEAGTLVTVIETHDDQGKVLRGRIQEPSGWISLQNNIDGYRWAKKENSSEESTTDDCTSSFHHVDTSDTSTEQGSVNIPYSLPPPVATLPQNSPWRAPGHLKQGVESLAGSGSPCGGMADRASREPPPDVLHVLSPNGQRQCEGEYTLVAVLRANGMPLWRHVDGEHWLYSSTTGRWCIGGADVKDDSFDRSAGWITQTAPHRGIMPHKVFTVWQRWDGHSFRKDEYGVAVISRKPKVAGDPKGHADRGEDVDDQLDLRGRAYNQDYERKLRSGEIERVVV